MNYIAVKLLQHLHHLAYYWAVVYALYFNIILILFLLLNLQVEKVESE